MADKKTRVDIVRASRDNNAFRREVVTGTYEQVVVMTIPPGGEIGEEVHDDSDQVLVFVDGQGEAILDGETSAIGPNDLVFVRAGTRHNFVNTGDGRCGSSPSTHRRSTSRGPSIRPRKKRTRPKRTTEASRNRTPVPSAPAAVDSPMP